ncbi:MAG: DUF817 domain-containing protein [Patescibacteria group bacterium]
MTMPAFLKEFLVFGLKQARAAVFAGSFFVLLFASQHLPLGPLARYDFLFLAALALQVVLYLTRIETKDEIKTIALFHVLGLLLEIYKTDPRIGSWAYPEAGLLKIHTVPLYSGFMYAAVGSYISQSWRVMKLEIAGNVDHIAAGLLAIAIYVNFFTNHFLPDIRWFLILAVFFIYRKAWVRFTVTDRIRRIPLAVSFFLIAFFIWVAENVSTYYGAWKYPYQLTTWNMVSWHKITSWYLLVIISFILIANLKRLKGRRTSKNPESRDDD